MVKFVRPNLKNLSFPSSSYPEEDNNPVQPYRGCFTYGEAASALLINFSKGEFFKIFYRGFDAEHLVWLPYDEDEDDELNFPIQFRFKDGCVDELATSIFNCFIRPCALPVNFHHG